MSVEGGPTRTCVGCRAKAPARELLRVVARDGAAVPDPGHRLPGRGAHLHPDAACLAQAERRRALPRALRMRAPLDLSALHAQLDP
ncbi:MAG: YlxR family protein [Actinomycetes bacterium]